MDNTHKPKILLCEDDTNLGMVLKNYLELNDYEVVLERDGRLGLAAFQREKFDICLLDVMMPGMNGYEVTRHIRQNDHLPLIPIILVTACEEASAAEGFEAGANDFIRKPINFDKLLAKITALC